MANCMLCNEKIKAVDAFLDGNYMLSKEHRDIIICKNCFFRKKRMITNAKHKNEMFIDSFNFFNNMIVEQTIKEKRVEEALKNILDGIDGSIETTSQILKEKEEKREKKLKNQKEREEAIEREREERQQKIQYNRENFMFNTGYNFEGYYISRYLGIVSGETVLGSGFLSELSGQLNDFFGSSSNAFSSKMRQAKEQAQDIMKENALRLGANAIIGVDFDVMTLGNNMIAVSVNGTAVEIESLQEDNVVYEDYDY